MGLFFYDFYSQAEVPTFTLANPDGTELYSLGTIHDRALKLKFNALSELTFTAPAIVDGISSDYYNSLAYRRMVKVNNVANFMITDIEEDNDGKMQIKRVTCQSLEVQFSTIKLSLFTGTYTFNNILTSGGVSTKNLLNTLISYIPGWTYNYVDPSLTNITRTFNITDKSLYDFMMNDVSQTYQCVFIFDTIKKEIAVYAIPNCTTNTDIFLSFDNLIDKRVIKTVTSELVTALTVLGGTNLYINQVNPLGGNILYNFNYFKTLDWMKQDLIDAITLWENKTNTYQPIYANLLTSEEGFSGSLLTYQSDLANLQAQLAGLQDVRNARIQQGLPIADIDNQISVVNGEISGKNTEIGETQNQINNIESQLTSINTDLSFNTNFTTAQQVILNNYIIGSTYTNTDFVTTDSMNLVEIQQQAQGLYDLAETVLAKVSWPRYTFDIDAVNFPFLKEFEQFANQLALGCVVTVDMDDGTFMYPVLLELDFNYDDPTQFKMIFSNRVRLDDSSFQYSDLFSSTVSAGITTNFNSQQWNSWQGYRSGGIQGSGIAINNNLAVFSGTSGSLIKDIGAQYLPPTDYTPTLLCDDATFVYNNFESTGIYTIIGKMCFFECSFLVSSIIGDGTSQVFLTLPVLCAPSYKMINTGYLGLVLLVGNWMGIVFPPDRGAIFTVEGYLITGADLVNIFIAISGFYLIN